MTKNLFTVRQFSEKHPAFPQGGLRYTIFHAKKNGFTKCLQRVGRKVLIDEDQFFKWIEEQGGQS